MKKSLLSVLDSFENTLVGIDGITAADKSTAEKAEIESLVFDSRDVKGNSLFFALPGTHTTGNNFIAAAVENGASAVVFQDTFSDEEKKAIADAVAARVNKGNEAPVFVKVQNARFAMSPIASCFYDNPSSKLNIRSEERRVGKECRSRW